MKLYRKIDEQGMFIEDVLLDAIPYLMQTVTETVTETEYEIQFRDEVQTVIETITNEDGTTQEVTHDVTVSIPIEVPIEVSHEVTYDKVVTEDTTENILDENGNVIDTITTSTPVYNPFYIETPCPQGFYQPKWSGTEWIEGGQPPTPQPQEPSTEERLQSLEDAMLFLTLGGM